GYTNGTTWVCTGTGTQNGANVTLTLGQSETCTITNTAQAPQLKLTKTVGNTYSTATPTTNSTRTANRTSKRQSATRRTNVDVNADTYALTLHVALPTSGYTNGTTWVCTGTGTQNGANVTLTLGQSETCTITNTAQAPMLALTKSVGAGTTGFTPIANTNWSPDRTSVV